MGSAAAKCRNHTDLRLTLFGRITPLTCLSDLHRPPCHWFSRCGLGDHLGTTT